MADPSGQERLWCSARYNIGDRGIIRLHRSRGEPLENDGCGSSTRQTAFAFGRGYRSQFQFLQAVGVSCSFRFGFALNRFEIFYRRIDEKANGWVEFLRIVRLTAGAATFVDEVIASRMARSNGNDREGYFIWDGPDHEKGVDHRDHGAGRQPPGRLVARARATRFTGSSAAPAPRTFERIAHLTGKSSSASGRPARSVLARSRCCKTCSRTRSTTWRP